MADQGWLFRDGDLILGPVAAQAIIDKLYAGELAAASEVQAMGSGRFQKLIDVPEFKVHVAKAEAKKRVDAQAQAHHDDVKASRNKAITIGAVVIVVLGVIVALVGNSLAKHSFDGKSAEELAWGDITIDAPTISKARRGSDEEFVDYNGSGRKNPATTTTGRTNPGTKSNPGTKMGAADSDGLQMAEVDEAGINAVVAANKAKLIGCIRAVAKPGEFMKIPIEFAIADGGKVSKVWVDNPSLKQDASFNDCLLKELQKWPFQARHSGNSVNLSFNVGKKS